MTQKRTRTARADMHDDDAKEKTIKMEVSSSWPTSRTSADRPALEYGKQTTKLLHRDKFTGRQSNKRPQTLNKQKREIRRREQHQYGTHEADKKRNKTSTASNTKKKSSDKPNRTKCEVGEHENTTEKMLRENRLTSQTNNNLLRKQPDGMDVRATTNVIAPSSCNNQINTANYRTNTE